MGSGRWLAAAGVMGVVFAACGGDDGGKRGAAGAGGAGEDAGVNGGGGEATAGRSGAGGARGGATGSGGAGGDPDSGTDAGNACTPRDDLPAPVYPSITVQSSCNARTPCGGTIADGEWVLTDECIDAGNLFPQIAGRCSAATVRSSVDPEAGGTMTVTNGSLTIDLHAAVTASIDFPNACHGCRCSDLEGELVRAGMTGVSCSPQCAGGSCFCTASKTVDVSVSSPFTTTADTITLGARRFEYCVAGGELSVREGSGGPALAFRPASAVATPEICDGVDNDRNGVADDDLAECPGACNTEGVCADVTVRCSGRSGWTCEYGSTARETGEETICDDLDNDCDGFVDEGIERCTEACNGLDDDDNGIVDDDPRDPHGCPTFTGVCTEGVTATCEGSTGWLCNYSSAEYEAAESKCDRLDNDCDGLTDEGCGCPTGASKVYVLSYAGNSTAPENGIYRANLDGTGVEPILNLTGSTVLGFQVNPADDKVYYYDFVNEELRRVPLAGGASEHVWTGETQQWSIDPGAGRVYVECGLANVCAFDIETPGTVDTIVVPATVSALTVDPFTRKIYWADLSDTTNRTINRVDLDGTRREEVFGTGTYSPGFLVLDLPGQRAYTGGLSGVSAADFVSKEWSAIYTSANAGVEGVALDARAGKLYWTENGNGVVRRGNVDGSNVEPVITTIAEPWGIDLYLCAP